MNCAIALACQTATHHDVNPADLNESNLSDVLFQSLKNNIKPCETYDLSQKTFIFDNNSSYFSSISTSPLCKLILTTLKNFF